VKQVGRSAVPPPEYRKAQPCLAEGRIIYNNQSSIFNYEYHLRDHLGNTRTAFTAAGVVQDNAYFAKPCVAKQCLSVVLYNNRHSKKLTKFGFYILSRLFLLIFRSKCQNSKSNFEQNMFFFE